MTAGESGLLQTGVWLIPIILLVTIGGLYLFERYLENQTNKKLKGFRGELRRLTTEIKQLEAAVQFYSPDDPEPFGSHASILQSEFEEIKNRAFELEQQHISLNVQLREFSANRWRAMMSAPYYWFMIRQDVSRIALELEKVHQLVKEANRVEGVISNLSWQLALRVREVQQTHKQLSETLEKLKARSITGDTFENALQIEANIKATLSNIPSFFSQADQAVVLELGNVENSAPVYETLEQIQPTLEQLIADSASWTESYQQVNAKVAIMQQELKETNNTLSHLPNSIDATSVQQFYTGITVIADNLQATLSRLEIENIDQVIQETERVTKSVKETNQSLKRARRQSGTLDKLQVELSDGFRHVSMQLARLGAQTIFPIQWQQSDEKLVKLNRQANSLSPIGSPRSPEQVHQELELAYNLNSELKILISHCQQIEDHHNTLIELIKSPELNQIDKWLQNAQEISDQATDYAPENWPSADDVSTLSTAVDSLESKANRLVLTNHPTPIAENDIALRLKETQQLAEEITTQTKRLKNIKSRLAEIAESEKQGKEQLEAVQILLNQLDLIIKSNDFLTKVAEQELHRLLTDVQETHNLLLEPHRSVVEKKIRQIATLSTKIEVAANHWLSQLNQDIRSLMESLSASLTSLDEIANLNEPAVAAARRLLSSGQAAGVGVYVESSNYKSENLIPKFKQHSDYWQSCIAAQNALDDVKTPVLESFEQVKHSRYQAQAMLEDILSWLRTKRYWPPTSVSIEEERLEWDRIETEWTKIKETQQKAITLVQHLGRLSASYQTLGAKLRQKTERVTHEQKQAEEMEDEINEFRQFWQMQANTHSDNPAAKQEIEDLLTAIDSKMSNLQRDYQNGRLSYQQVIETMRTINRQIRFFQVALDEDHALDSTGNINQRR
jgi:hypothetical protein